MDVVIPFDAERPKTRLSPVFAADERAAFARAMLRDVVSAVGETGQEPTVLATASVDVAGATVRVDDRPLDDAVNGALDDRTLPVAVVMADLPLVTPDAVRRLFATTGDVVLARGLGGGTNALVSRHPEFSVDYHGASFRDHVERAKDCGATLGTVDSYRLGVDVDEPADLTEVLLHGTGEASDWLDRAGVEVEVRDGRATAVRTRDGLEPPGQ